MWRPLIDKWRRSESPAPAVSSRMVPHAEWSQWLTQGQWDQAAVCLDQWRQTSQKPELAILIPQWEKQLVEAFLRQAWADLKPETAVRWLRRTDRFADRGVSDHRLETFRQTADLIWDLERSESRGDCAQALQKLDQAMGLMKQAGQDGLTRHLSEAHRPRLTQGHDLILEWAVRMRIHSDDGQHTQAMALAQRIIAIAPEHPGAQAVLKRKLDQTLPVTDLPVSHDATVVHVPISDPQTNDPAPIQSTLPKPISAGLWQVSLDRADSWLLSTAAEIVLDEGMDKRLADALGHEFQSGRIHLSRDEEGCWVFETDTDIVQLNGKWTRRGCLLDGSEIRFGNGPEMRFIQPRMETGSARLERVGRPSPEGVRGLVLMGSMMNIGGDPKAAEIPHKSISQPIVVWLRTGQLWARHDQPWTANGVLNHGESPIRPPYQMRVGDVGLYWESSP